MKSFLSEAVSMARLWLRARRDRRHDPRSTAALFTPDFHREITGGAARTTNNDDDHDNNDVEIDDVDKNVGPSMIVV